MDDILKHKRPRNLVGGTDMSRRYVDSKGVQRVCGGKDLKASQHYPLGTLGKTSYRFVSKLWGSVGPDTNRQSRLDHPSMSSCQLRFGEALAAVRSDTMDVRHREAKKFIALALKSSNEMDSRPRPNNILIRGADLKPVVNFLSGCQKA